MTPKEFQKSNLRAELKAGKKRLEVALHGLSDEQFQKAGATRSDSIVDLLSEIVSKEFLALVEVSDPLPSVPMNLLTNADDGTLTASGAEKDIANKSVENLLAKFGVLRSVVMRRMEDRKPQGAKFDANYAYVADACVARLHEQIDEIEAVAQFGNRAIQRSASPRGGARSAAKSGHCGLESRGFPGREFRFEVAFLTATGPVLQRRFRSVARCRRDQWKDCCLPAHGGPAGTDQYAARDGTGFHGFFSHQSERRTLRGISSPIGRPFS
jgi:hypothetical protein